MNPIDVQASELAGGRRTRRWWVRGAIIVAAAIAIWFVCENAGHWKDRFVPRKLRTVVPGQIYASGQIDRHLIRQVLIGDRIKVIVCLVADDPSDPDVAAELEAVKDLGIQRFVDPLGGDGTGDIHSYADAVAQMVEAQSQGKPVLVHCSSGAQRSNGATFYYRVLVQHWDADSAAQEMVRNGHSSRSNPALVPYLNLHMREIAAILVDKAVIDHIPEPLPQIQHE
jgi:protein tyrosine phosphatase (PTP) superfamily phosphohydrolase (DUF442 family)